MKFEEILEACWKGYHREGNKKMFGKTYPNCVKNTNEEQGVAEGKIKLYTDPSYFGAEVDDTGFDSLPVVNIPANRLVGFEPDDKMNQPKSVENVKKIMTGLKQGDKLPPLLVREYKQGYQVLDGHHRFWAYKQAGVKSIPVRIVPAEDIEEIGKQGVAEGHADQQRKIFKKNGEPVGEVGIDRESSPGVGQYYMKHYASGKDLAGYDSYEEALEELKHFMKQGVAEGARVARKPGQPAGSKKHSDLYTDENPRGTITGLKFATVEDARASVSKIRNSGRSHAHKIQAAVAMEQRARAAGKASAAAVYRRYINANKRTDEQQLDEKCWDGYSQKGVKKKGDRMVPNCVPVAEVKTGPEITGRDLLFKAAAMAMRDAGREGVTLDYEQAIKQASKIYGIPYTPSELPKLLAQRAEIDRQLALLKQAKQVAKARRKEKLAPTPAGAEEYWRTHALPTDRIKPATKTLEETEAELAEDLKKWFKQKWVRFGPDGKIRGDCARGSSKEGKPKCLPQSKAHALGKKGRASAAAKKRREDPNPERRGAAKNVATRVKEDDLDEACWKGYHKEGMKTMFGKKYPNCVKNKKTNEEQGVAEGIPFDQCPSCGGSIVHESELTEKQDACYHKVKSRYKVWPSAYASGALVQCRKKGAANWGNKKK